MGSLPGCTPASGLAIPSGAPQGQVLTVVTAPVDVDAAPVVAGELRQGEAGRVGCGGGRVTISTGDTSCAPQPSLGVPCAPSVPSAPSPSSPHEADSSERSPQSSSRSHVQEMGMQRPLAQENWLGEQVRAGQEGQMEC